MFSTELLKPLQVTRTAYFFSARKFHQFDYSIN